VWVSSCAAHTTPLLTCTSVPGCPEGPARLPHEVITPLPACLRRHHTPTVVSVSSSRSPIKAEQMIALFPVASDRRGGKTPAIAEMRGVLSRGGCLVLTRDKPILQRTHTGLLAGEAVLSTPFDA